MNERELIDAVLKRRPGAESTLDYLDQKGFLAEALDGVSDDPVGYLVEEIDRIWAAGPDSAVRTLPAGGVPHSTMFDYLTPYEQELVAARSEVLAADAAANEAVRTFRDRFTGGVPLALQRAEVFVNSPAATNLPTSWFEENGTPFVDHDARMISVDRRGQWEVLEFQVDPPGVVFRIELERGPEAPEYRGRMLLVVGPRRFEQPEVATLVRVGSPLDQLRKVGARLAAIYPEWQDHSATRFVLTGEAPPVNPLRWELGPDGTTVLHVAPGISAATVEKAYRRALWSQGRKKERHSSKGASSGRAAKSVRKLGKKNLKLLRFVVARTDHRGHRPLGKEVVAEWDRELPKWELPKWELPKWAYRGNTRKMWRDYGRALEKVAPTLAQARKESRQRQ